MTNNRHNGKLDFIVYGLSYKHSTFFRTSETSFHSVWAYGSTMYANVSLHENHTCICMVDKWKICIYDLHEGHVYLFLLFHWDYYYVLIIIKC